MERENTFSTDFMSPEFLGSMRGIKKTPVEKAVNEEENPAEVKTEVTEKEPEGSIDTAVDTDEAKLTESLATEQISESEDGESHNDNEVSSVEDDLKTDEVKGEEK